MKTLVAVFKLQERKDEVVSSPHVLNDALAKGEEAARTTATLTLGRFESAMYKKV